MALSAFDDKSRPPNDDELAATFKAYGWGLRLKRDKRAILYMTPCHGHFLASFALGEKAITAAHESRLPASVLKVIDDAPKYAEGRGVRLEVRSAKNIRHIEELAEIKMTK